MDKMIVDHNDCNSVSFIRRAVSPEGDNSPRNW